ncbi:MAG: hypothetical protein U0992_14910 [Planctomycetaceae bacterium]
MTATRSRRIVRRVVMVLAVVVLLVVWYVGVWVGASRAGKARLISRNTTKVIRPVFEPIISYTDSDRPGAELLFKMWWKLNPPGLVKRPGSDPPCYRLDISPLSPVARPIPLLELPPDVHLCRL